MVAMVEPSVERWTGRRSVEFQAVVPVLDEVRMVCGAGNQTPAGSGETGAGRPIGWRAGRLRSNSRLSVWGPSRTWCTAIRARDRPSGENAAEVNTVCAVGSVKLPTKRRD